MKEVLILLAVLIAFGASGRIFGIDRVAYESREEVVDYNIEHFTAPYD